MEPLAEITKSLALGLWAGDFSGPGMLYICGILNCSCTSIHVTLIIIFLLICSFILQLDMVALYDYCKKLRYAPVLCLKYMYHGAKTVGWET